MDECEALQLRIYAEQPQTMHGELVSLCALKLGHNFTVRLHAAASNCYKP